MQESVPDKEHAGRLLLRFSAPGSNIFPYFLSTYRILPGFVSYAHCSPVPSACDSVCLRSLDIDLLPVVDDPVLVRFYFQSAKALPFLLLPITTYTPLPESTASGLFAWLFFAISSVLKSPCIGLSAHYLIVLPYFLIELLLGHSLKVREVLNRQDRICSAKRPRKSTDDARTYKV